jgi:hypothetical protein
VQYKQKLPLLFEAQGQGWVQAKKDKEEECNSEAWVRVWGVCKYIFSRPAGCITLLTNQPNNQPSQGYYVSQ